jgi:hypothetical protein
MHACPSRALARVTAVLAAAVAIAASVGAGCGGSDEGDESGFQITGSWSGELHQQDLTPFRVRAAILDLENPEKNTVHYSGIDCGGNWTFLGRQSEVYRFREEINRGAGGNCKGTGIVTLTAKGDDSLAYVFRGGGIESEGTLTRGG